MDAVGRSDDGDRGAVVYIIGIRSVRSDDVGNSFIENLDGKHTQRADIITLTIGLVIYLIRRQIAVRIDCERCFGYSVTTTVAEFEFATFNGKAIRGSDGNGAMISISIFGLPAISRRVIQLSFQCNLDSVVAPGTGSRGAGCEYFGLGRWQDDLELAAVVAGEGEGWIMCEGGTEGGVLGRHGEGLLGTESVVDSGVVAPRGHVVDCRRGGLDGQLRAGQHAEGVGLRGDDHARDSDGAGNVQVLDINTVSISDANSMYTHIVGAVLGRGEGARVMGILSWWISVAYHHAASR